MPGTKELTEVLRAYSVVQAKVIARSADGEFSRWDGAKVLATSMPDIWRAIAGCGLIIAEIKDITFTEWDGIIEEIMPILARSKKFTFRERDIADRILRMAFREIKELSEIIHLPPTAVLVEEDPELVGP